MTEPCLLITLDGPVARLTGMASCRLGHRLPRSDGRADGVYGGWDWDGLTLRAENDRYGMFPLYYFSCSNRCAISPSVPALLSVGAPTEFDEPALAVFLRLGFFLGEDTPFRAIRALPPGATLEWSAGQLKLSGGISRLRAQPLERNQAIDGYIELFRNAMARRIRPEEDVAVPLSGGRDSRHILLELCDAGRRPRLVITLHAFPPFGSEDDIARQVAAAVALPHVILPQRRARFIAEIRKNRITNFCADEHAWYLALADYLEGRARHIYDGIGGDVLSAGLFLTVNRLALFQTGRFEELALHLFQDSGPIIGLLAPQWKTLLNAEVALARLTPELVRHADAPNPVGSFYFWNRTRREIALAPYRILSRSVEVLSPYLDWDLFDFLASLPATLLLDHAFHTETIRRAYPAHADLRFAEPRKLRLAPVEFRRFAAEIAAYALRHAWASTVQLADRQGILTRSAIAAIAGRTDRFNWRLSVLTLYLLQLSHEGTGARR